jgi:hypothetical protein
MIYRILQSFRLIKMRVNFDTDDYILNAYLYPLFYFLSKNNRNLNINFNGDLYLELLMISRPIRIVLAYLGWKKFSSLIKL